MGSEKRDSVILHLEDFEDLDELTNAEAGKLIKAILANADAKGRIKLDDIVAYFRNYYDDRRNSGLIVEKANSIFAKGGYTDKDAQRNILSNPFKRFEDMQMLRHTKTLGIVEVEPTVWKNLSDGDKEEMMQICDEKLESYYMRFLNNCKP